MKKIATLVIGLIIISAGLISGCVDEKPKPKPQENNAPVALFSWTADGLVVTFTNQCTDSDEGDTLQYSWNFGDGEASTEENPIHTYAQNDTYNVTLTVDDGEDTDTEEKSIPISEETTTNTDPEAGFTYEIDDMTVTFTDNSLDADGDTLTYTWNFGDGNTSSEQNPTHTYAQNDIYAVTLNVSDGVNFDEYNEEITIEEGSSSSESLTANFDSSPTQISLTVLFIDSSVPADTIVSWLWEFGDGNTNEIQGPISYVYNAAGTYDVTLTVTDGQGQSDSITKQVTVA